MMRCSSSRRAGPADRLRRGDPGAEHRRTGRGGRLRPGSLRLGRTRAADRLGRDRTRTAAPPVRRRSRQPVPPPEHDETRAAQADMATARDAVPDRTGTARKSVPSDRDAGQSHARRADRRDTLVSPAGFDDLLKVAQQIDHEHRIRHSRPVSAKTLRKEMRIGSARARTLVKRVRGLHEPATQTKPDPGREAASAAS